MRAEQKATYNEPREVVLAPATMKSSTRTSPTATSNELVDYALELARIKPNKTKFVIVDGSTAEGSDRKHSDYDVTVVRKGLSEPSGSVKDLFGVFNGRVFSGWLVDEESFRHRYIGDDDKDFPWRKRQLSKAKLLYGDRKEFARIIRKALSRNWNKKRQMAVIHYSYVTMIEYMGKMLNKIETHEDGTPEFFQDGYVIGTNAAMLIAALNQLDLDSDKTMYRQISNEAKIKPPNFEHDFKTVSGLAGTERTRKAVVSASRRLLEWSREEILDSFEPLEDNGSDFWKIVREMRF